MLFAYPKQAKFGRVIPKTKLYENAHINRTLKEKFVSQVDKIIWQYKLAPETLNLNASSTVPEIQVFDIRLKGDDIGEDVLRAIDKAIPFPIIFQIYQADKVKFKAAYKRPSDADTNRWVVETYFESEWVDADTPRESLPVALDLGKLYEQMLTTLMPIEMTSRTSALSMKEQVEQIDNIQAKEKEYEKLKAKRDKEKQFNRKAELNKQLKNLQKELDYLKQSDI